MPAKTPREIVERLEKVFKDKDLIEKFERTGWFVENLGLAEGTDYFNLN